MRFYHVSNNPNLHNLVITPRIPSSKMNCEDKDTSRICVSPSINGCLTAANRYDVGEILDVYVCETEHFIQPSCKKVVDAPLAGEFWIVEPVRFQHFMRIEITNVFESHFEGINNYFYAFKKII